MRPGDRRRQSGIANSRHLGEAAIARGVDGNLIDGPEEIDRVWLEGRQRSGLTAGASTLEILVQRVVDRVIRFAGAEVSQTVGVEERVSFALPREREWLDY